MSLIINQNPGLHNRNLHDDNYIFPNDSKDPVFAAIKQKDLKLDTCNQLSCIKDLKVAQDQTNALIYVGKNPLPSNTIVGPYSGKLVSKYRDIGNEDYSIFLNNLSVDCWIDATTHGNIISYVVHSASPNCEITCVYYDGLIRAVLKTKTTINSGEHLSIDKTLYRASVDESMYLPYILHKHQGKRYYRLPRVQGWGRTLVASYIVRASVKKSDLYPAGTHWYSVECCAWDSQEDAPVVLVQRLQPKEGKRFDKTAEFQIIHQWDIHDVLETYFHNNKTISGYIGKDGVWSDTMLEEHDPQPHEDKMMATLDPKWNPSARKKRKEAMSDAARPKCPWTPDPEHKYSRLEYVNSSGTAIREGHFIVVNIGKLLVSEHIHFGKEIFRVACVAINQQTDQEILLAQHYRVYTDDEPIKLLATPNFKILSPSNIIERVNIPDINECINNNNEIVTNPGDEFNWKKQAEILMAKPKDPAFKKRGRSKRKRDDEFSDGEWTSDPEDELRNTPSKPKSKGSEDFVINEFSSVVGNAGGTQSLSPPKENGQRPSWSAIQYFPQEDDATSPPQPPTVPAEEVHAVAANPPKEIAEVTPEAKPSPQELPPGKVASEQPASPNKESIQQQLCSPSKASAMDVEKELSEPQLLMKHLGIVVELSKKIDWNSYLESDINKGDAFKMYGFLKLVKTRMKTQLQTHSV